MKRLIPLLAAGLLLFGSLDAGSQTSGNRYGRMAESMLDMMDAFTSAYQKRQGSPSMPQRQRPQGGLSWPQSVNPGSMPWTQGMTMNPWSSMYSMPFSQGTSPWNMVNPMTGANPFGMTSPGSMPWQQMPMMPGAEQMNPFQESFPQGPFDGGGFPAAGSLLEGRWQGRAGEIFEVHGNRFRIYQDPQNYREGIIEQIDDRRLSMRDPESGVTREYEYAVNQGRLVLRDTAGNLMLYRQLTQ